MFPTFPKVAGTDDKELITQSVAYPKMRRYPGGINLFGRQYLFYNLQHGDIVEFENEEVRKISKEKYGDETGFVKRLIGLPNDSIQMRDGFLYRNGQIITEPYTAKARSTYGGDFVADCQLINIPTGKIFVLGDNRKASLDSRFEIGFIDISDIHYVLPFNKQDEYTKSWRNTDNDAAFAHTATLDSAKFIDMLNEKRYEKKLPVLKYNQKLALSSQNRGSVMIQTDDFSTTASKSGYPLEKAVKESGYNNIIFAEIFTRGFFEAEELMENIMEFPDTLKIMLSPEYQDIGLSAVLGDVDDCPTQVVVAHLGGYRPPDYTKKELDSWGKLVENIEKVLPSWEAIRGAEGVDQVKLSRLLEVLYARANNARTVLARMKKNEWLTETEKTMIKNDSELGSEAEKIIETLLKQ